MVFCLKFLENYSYHELIDVINLRNSFDRIVDANYSLIQKK